MIDSRFIPDVPSSDPPVTHRPEAHRFENLTDGHLSFATYQLDRSARQVVFDHTLVPPQLQGRGIAAALISTALDWAADEGLQVAGMGQGFLSMAAPMKEFERRLLRKAIRHGNNPVLNWMAGNVSVKMDPAGNLKPDKSTSQGKIDGIVALVMALDRLMRHNKPRQASMRPAG